MIGVECIGCAKPLQLKRRYVYTGPGGVSSLATDPPGPRWPPAESKCEKRSAKSKKTKHRKRLEDLHLFRCSTHTPRCREAFFNGSPPPCLKRKNERSSSSLQMFDIHAPMPRGFFPAVYSYIYIYIYIYTQDLDLTSLPKGKG